MPKSRELALKIRDAKKKNQGTGGSIRIVLPSVPRDPLLRPGQQRRGLSLLGQNPDKPPPETIWGHDGGPGVARPDPGSAPHLEPR
jgi:hypothetical protein